MLKTPLIMSALLLAACAAPMPMPLSASGPSEVLLDGVAYLAELEPLSGDAQITVTRAGAALGMDEGLTAKRVATAFCAARGAGLDPSALGLFSQGSWVFDGGCA